MLAEIPLNTPPVVKDEVTDIGFIPSAMAYVAMPHSEQKGAAILKRTNGRASFSILTDPDIGLPYGKIPRIMVAFICSQAKRKGLRTIDIGDNQTQFMKMLGMDSTGGTNGAIHRVRDQAHRLFMSTISITSTFTDDEGQGEGLKWNKLNISDDGFSLWRPHADRGQRWVGEVTLTEKFFNECIEHAVPLSMNAMHALRSPLALDIYAWLAFRYNDISRPVNISWPQLQMQLACGYPQTQRGALDFRRNFKKQIAEVSSEYKEARYTMTENGILLLPSKTHITKR